MFFRINDAWDRLLAPGRILWLALVLFSHRGNALDALSLDIGSLAVKGWRLEDVNISLAGIPKRRQQLALTIGKLSLPKPFDDLKLADIRCNAFTWGKNQILCEDGEARVDSRYWRSPRTGFNFRLSEKSSKVHLTGLEVWGGKVNAVLTEESMHWRVNLQANHLDGLYLQKHVPAKLIDFKKGALNLTINASGVQKMIDTIDATAQFEQLTLQTPNGRTATEDVSLTAHGHAKNRGDVWQWRHEGRLTGGALFREPIYLEAANNPLTFRAQGFWSTQSRRVEIESFRLSDPKAAELNGRLSAVFDANPHLERAAFEVETDDLSRFWSVYLRPFAEQTSFAGLSLQGSARAHIDVDQSALRRFQLNVGRLDVHDPNGRLAADGGEAAVYWSSDPSFALPSTIKWQELSLYALPLGPGRLSFLSRGKTIELLEKARIPFLGGEMEVDKFNWQSRPEGEPDVYFEGGIQNVSLERLSSALDWTPLSGTLSGKIPGIHYRDNRLKLDGELKVSVFDGIVRIANLASSGFFRDYPELSADIEFDHLGLDQLTRKFQFGGITGRLSGFVKQLRLENWRPVTFFAWFGTPDDDDSRHRISQKAVRNIASIGGGGAADILSRSFLRVFETFGYDRIGLGCYLHDGVCQLMGIEASGDGYSIIRGGGLPRIDVIGYNSEIDWAVLMERLERITDSDQVIVE